MKQNDSHWNLLFRWLLVTGVLMTLPSSLLVYSTLLGGKGSPAEALELLAGGSKRAAKDVGWVSCPGLELEEPAKEPEMEPAVDSEWSAGGTRTCGGSPLLLVPLMLLPGSGSVTLDGKAEEAVGTLGRRGGLVGIRVLLLAAAPPAAGPKLSGSKGTPGPTSG